MPHQPRPNPLHRRSQHPPRFQRLQGFTPSPGTPWDPAVLRGRWKGWGEADFLLLTRGLPPPSPPVVPATLKRTEHAQLQILFTCTWTEPGDRPNRTRRLGLRYACQNLRCGSLHISAPLRSLGCSSSCRRESRLTFPLSRQGGKLPQQHQLGQNFLLQPASMPVHGLKSGQ